MIYVDEVVAEEFVPCLLDVVRSEEGEEEMREMAALALCAAVRKSSIAMEQCIGDPLLKGLLEARLQKSSTAEVCVCVCVCVFLCTLCCVAEHRERIRKGRGGKGMGEEGEEGDSIQM